MCGEGCAVLEDGRTVVRTYYELSCCPRGPPSPPLAPRSAQPPLAPRGSPLPCPPRSHRADRPRPRSHRVGLRRRAHRAVTALSADVARMWAFRPQHPRLASSLRTNPCFLHAKNLRPHVVELLVRRPYILRIPSVPARARAPLVRCFRCRKWGVSP